MATKKKIEKLPEHLEYSSYTTVTIPFTPAEKKKLKKLAFVQFPGYESMTDVRGVTVAKEVKVNYGLIFSPDFKCIANSVIESSELKYARIRSNEGKRETSLFENLLDWLS